MAAWFDHTGKRRERYTRTTDRRAAERILSKHVADTALRRDGVIDAGKDRYTVENRKPLVQHIEDYVGHCRKTGQADSNVKGKVLHLNRLIKWTGMVRLSDFTADILENHMRAMQESGLSARTINFTREISHAFMIWGRRTGRLESNPLSVVV